MRAMKNTPIIPDPSPLDWLLDILLFVSKIFTKKKYKQANHPLLYNQLSMELLMARLAITSHLNQGLLPTPNTREKNWQYTGNITICCHTPLWLSLAYYQLEQLCELALLVIGCHVRRGRVGFAALTS